jgi:cell cycle checkpoint control protein RAD9A
LCGSTCKLLLTLQTLKSSTSSAGIRKTYWISCSNDCEILQAAVDRNTFPSHLVVKPKDLSRLLGNFQASLQEITIIATEPAATPYTEASAGTEAKAVEMRSFVDRTKGGA